MMSLTGGLKYLKLTGGGLFGVIRLLYQISINWHSKLYMVNSSLEPRNLVNTEAAESDMLGIIHDQNVHLWCIQTLLKEIFLALS